MSFDYAVLGAGRQGVAVAFDLMLRGQARRVRLLDADPDVAARAAQRLRRLLPESACAVEPLGCDAGDVAQVERAIAGCRVAVSAVPFPFNPGLTAAAIRVGACFCDLGGNTSVVRQELALHEAALAAGVSVVPDCGLAPGLANHLAAHGIQSLDEPEHAHIRCGGLPQRPVGPLGYKLVFSVQGLINEYSGSAEFLRDGRLTRVPALTEVETIDFPPPVGRCEAAVTSGGTSTCPQTYEGRLTTYDYKTVRYPGHFAIVRALFELGCFDERVELSDGTVARPRQLMQALLEQRLSFPDVGDLVVLRVTVTGRHQGRAARLQYDLLDYQDDRTGFSAMERTTGFPAGLVAHMQARGLVAPGARPLELAVPAGRFFEELPLHDLHVHLTRT